VLIGIITEYDIIAKTIGIKGTVEGLYEKLVRFDRSNGTYLEFEQFLCIIFNAKGSWDELTKRVKSSTNGYGVTLGMSDGRLAIRIKKWHFVGSLWC
jgi:hypothetical protein